MPTPLEAKLSTYLYNAFRVEFDSRIVLSDEGVVISARPSSDRKDRMWIECSLRSRARLAVRAVPEPLSGPLFETMAHADNEHRMRCAEDIRALGEQSHSLRFSVGGIDLCTTPISDWPRYWSDLTFDATIWPLAPREELHELVEDCFEWMRRAFTPFFDLLDIEIEIRGFCEGDSQRVLATKYERDQRNRALCIKAKGCRCSICGFDFEEAYGILGKDFIHVHHIVPISEIGSGYIVDPINDLIPVCPNCHAMLHRVDPPMTPDMLRRAIHKNSNTKMDFC